MKHALISWVDKGDHSRVEFCKVCAAEARELTTDCPCHVVKPEIRQQVARGELDYANGEWINKDKR